jgi:hypothetical protein
MDTHQKPENPYFGIHVLLRDNAGAQALAEQAPRLAALGANLLIVEVNYSYAFTSHPELQAQDPIDRRHAQSLLQACQREGIRLVPQFQCLGHQSWAETTFPLLARYPEFDETPGQFPENKGIYCRSWCPQHPQVNPIVFDLMDELIDAFEADALHVGMDEVFLIASEHCPRCKGGDPAQLFARATNDYYAHLAGERNVEMLMWGDRLLDDAQMGYGEWESSRNGTHPAIALISKEILICDWHYEPGTAYPSVPFFQAQGFRVLPGGWRNEGAVAALIDYSRQHQQGRMLGYLATTWGAAKPGELADWPPIRAAAEKL